MNMLILEILFRKLTLKNKYVKDLINVMHLSSIIPLKTLQKHVQ